MKCKIRKWKLSDAKELAAVLSNNKVLMNLRDGIPYPYTENDAEKYIASMLSADENSTFAFAVEVDGKAVGNVGAFRKDNIHCKTAELGYYLSEEYWGSGIMTDAVIQLCRYIFDNTDIIRIFAVPFSHNSRSRRVLEKAGFEFEGIMRCSAVKDGLTMDSAMYSIIRREETFRRLMIEEIPAAVSMIWEVFCRFNASDCTDEGVEEFRNTAESSKSDSSVIFYGAFENGELVGALGLRLPRHISFFFVKSDRHGRGYGRKLFEAVRKEHGGGEYTVNSSLYAENFYRRLGFEPLDTEQTANGIRFVPMKYDRNGK